MELKLVATADGSNTIWNEQVGEHYHSKHGAYQESKHVFLKSGLEYLLEKDNLNQVNVLEVGFGTGLNFLLTADYCTQNFVKLNYEGIEAYPLDQRMIESTGYHAFVSPELWEDFTANYCNFFITGKELNRSCKLTILKTQLENFTSSTTFDLVYFDAFAAVHQPEMWTDEALKQACKNLRPGGVFVTYAITGNLKRSMKTLGFNVEKAPGAPGKREMLRAIKE